MPKEYVFEFIGTKEDFIKELDLYPNINCYNGKKHYYFDDFIVEVVGNTIRFGVERCGHSGGYWFIPSITEHENKIVFKGVIKYIGPEPEHKRSKFVQVIYKIQEYLLYIILIPLILAIAVCVKFFTFFKWIINKIQRKTNAPKPKNTEEKLFDLMENYLNCIRKDTN